jgi:hypothetical protein
MTAINSAFTCCSSLTDVYYNGTNSQWCGISISTSNSSLLEATIHYASVESLAGTCGDNLTWTLDDNGVLTLTGPTYPNDDHVEIVNEYAIGELDISKTVVSDSPSDQAQVFTFTVALKDAKDQPLSGTFDGVTFKGTFTPFVMPNGLNFQGGYLFLGQNNQLFWPNTSNPLKPFRAYFYVNVEASTPGNAPKYRGMPARIVEGKNVAIGVENAQSANQSTKVIVNGQLIIIKNDVRYNAQCQIVK